MDRTEGSCCASKLLSSFGPYEDQEVVSSPTLLQCDMLFLSTEIDVDRGRKRAACGVVQQTRRRIASIQYAMHLQTVTKKVCVRAEGAAYIRFRGGARPQIDVRHPHRHQTRTRSVRPSIISSYCTPTHIGLAFNLPSTLSIPVREIFLLCTGMTLL